MRHVAASRIKPENIIDKGDAHSINSVKDIRDGLQRIPAQQSRCKRNKPHAHKKKNVQPQNPKVELRYVAQTALMTNPQETQKNEGYDIREQVGQELREVSLQSCHAVHSDHGWHNQTEHQNRHDRGEYAIG